MFSSLNIKAIFKRIFFISNFFFFYLLIFPCFLIAQDSDPTANSSDPKDEQPENLEKIDNEDYGSSQVEYLHKLVSFGVLGAANRVGTFFGNLSKIKFF